MSWIHGVVSKEKSSKEKLKIKFNEDTIFRYENDDVLIFGGGSTKTLHSFELKKESTSHWLISGIGILSEVQGSRIFQSADWKSYIQEHGSEGLQLLDGHFIAVQISEESITFFSDILGLRDIYLTKRKESVYFSTNVSWLSQLFSVELDFLEFGSRWLLFNQVSNKSIFKNFIRVVGGKQVQVDLQYNNQIKCKEYNWLPPRKKASLSIEDYSSKLNALISLNMENNFSISLSLSGGMDSRVILSYLLKSGIHFDTHTFGNPNSPDSVIAKKIANRFKLDHDQLDWAFPNVENLLSEAQRYTCQTLVNNAASAVRQLHNYFLLKDRNIVIVDGGFGEIWRREFFYKLYLRGKKTIYQHATKEMIPFLRLHRADIFNEDASREMENGLEKQLDDLIEILPKINEVGVGNWLDIFAIKTRLMNYYSHEQTRLDENLVGIMPFLQPSILELLTNTPIELRQNGKLFRRIIKDNSKRLNNINLAKSDSMHPFFLNSLQSRVLAIAKKKVKFRIFEDKRVDEFLINSKQYVYDIIESNDVKYSQYYDYTKIKNIVDSYYSGDNSQQNSLDWLISFELFRSGHKIQ